MIADELADRWQAAWTGGDFAESCTAEVTYEDPVAVQPLEGRHVLARYAEGLGHAFPDLRCERHAPALVEGRFACLPWRVLGTHKGQLGLVPASDRFVVIQGVHYVELADDRIRRARGYFDLYDAGVQLGLLPSRGSLGETAMLMLRGFGLRPRS